MLQLPRSLRARSVVLVATVLVTVIVVVGLMVAPPLVMPDSEDEGYAEFDGVLPEQAPTSGQVDVDPSPEAGVVMIDMAHRNRVSPAQRDVLENVLTAAGYKVEYMDAVTRFDFELGEADSLIIIDPGLSYNSVRAARVAQFVEDGGRVVLLGEPRRLSVQGVSLVEIESEFGQLTSAFDLRFSGSYLYNMEENEGNFQHIYVEGMSTAVGEGVDRASVQTAAAVSSKEGSVVLRTTEGTQLGSGSQDTFTVGVQDGNVLAIGDSSFISKGNHLVNDNPALISNVVSFLGGGDRDRSLIDYPAVAGSNPTIQYTDPGLLPVAQSVSSDNKVVFGGQPDVVLEEAQGNPNNVDVLVATFDYIEAYPSISPGLSVDGDRVTAPGYDGGTEDLVIVHAPDSGPELVIAADSPGVAETVASELTRGDIDELLVSDSTAVYRESTG